MKDQATKYWARANLHRQYGFGELSYEQTDILLSLFFSIPSRNKHRRRESGLAIGLGKNHSSGEAGEPAPNLRRAGPLPSADLRRVSEGFSPDQGRRRSRQ